jgi:hypothetical protein
MGTNVAKGVKKNGRGGLGRRGRRMVAFPE